MNLAAANSIPLRLKPGELLVFRQPQEVITVLGSCVSITMFSRRLRLAAICHAMLPAPNHADAPGQPGAQPFRYLSLALPAMVSVFDRAGASRDEIEVKMFGGANVLGRASVRSPQGVGAANLRLARQLLHQERLHLRASDVGGTRGRKIVFYTGTGQVLHRYLS